MSKRGKAALRVVGALAALLFALLLMGIPDPDEYPDEI